MRFTKTLPALLTCLLLNSAVFAGSLQPSAPPGPTMKTLEQVEPRTDVMTLASGPEAVHVVTQPGAYYLTANVTGQSGKNGILIDCNDVTLDLNGFALLGVPDSQNGIQIAADKKNVAVLNGSIRKWSMNGLYGNSASAVQVRNISACSNSEAGIHVGANCIVQNCVAANNGWFGIRAEDNSIIESCTAKENGHGGLRLFSGGLIRNCVSEANIYEGISVEYETSVTGNTCVMNRWGITVSGSSNQVSGNTISLSHERGISCGGDGNRFEANHIAGNTNGIGILVEASANNNLIVKNSVTGYETAYSISAANSIGPIVDTTAGGDLSSIAGSEHPWANFIH